jgi:hypothetical protein
MTHLTEETKARHQEERERLAAQLRANLARRKQQGRGRDEAAAAAGVLPEDSASNEEAR